MPKIKAFKVLNTLRGRLVAWSLLVNSLLLIAFGAGVWLALQQVQYRQVNDTLQLSAAQLSAAVDNSNGLLTVPDDDLTILAARGVFTWITGDHGHIDLTTGIASKLPLPVMESDFQTIYDAQGNGLKLFRYVLKENGGTIIVGLSLEPIQRTLQTVLLILIVTIPLALLLSAIGSIFLAGRALKPIAAITAQAQRISRENLSERLAFASTDEVGQLARTFDHMMDRLQAAFEHERQFIGNVSHELRTPLSMLKAQISLAISRPRDVQTLTKMLIAMDGDVDRTVRLVERMLTLIRTEATTITFKPVDLNDLLSGLIAQMQPLAAEREITLMLKSPVSVIVSGDPDQLVQLFLNLVDNAVKHSMAGGQVRIAVTSEQFEWRIDICDQGIGIAPDDLAHVFDRFYRADPSRTRQTGGVGLGLAIAQAIVQQHDGHITAQSQVGQGSIFTVSLSKFML